MAIGFPPQTTYPLAIDSDKTLFLVFNTSEAKLAVNNSAWSEEIEIEPVRKDQEEIWADNGFANISGELFYYDSVERDDPVGSGAVLGGVMVNENGGIKSVAVINGGSGYFLPTIKVKGDGGGAKIRPVVEDGVIKSIEIINSGYGYSPSATSFEFQGKIYKFKRCARNIAGKKTNVNLAGCWVRGFVIAEHHNQLVDTTIAIEKYTLDLEKEIQNLEDQPDCLDDTSCPSIVFEITDIQTPDSSCLGTTITYTINTFGVINNFILDFGDGQTTTSSQNGSHTYAPNTTIDPIIIASNNSCSIVQTPIERTETTVPEPPSDTPILIPLPPPPDFPPITIPDCSVQDIGFDLPQIIFPQIDITPPCIPGINISIPDFGNISIPNISFGPVPFIPPSIEFGPLTATIPSSVQFNFGPAPNVTYPNGTFTFGPAPVVNFPNGAFTFGPAPAIEFGPAPEVYFEWGSPPTATGSFEWGSPPMATGSFEWGSPPQLSVEWGSAPTISVNVTCQCCPSGGGGVSMTSRSRILDEEFEDNFDENKINFELENNDIGIPSEIKIIAPEFPDIQIRHDIPDFISIESNIPNRIELYQENPIIHAHEIKFVNENIIPKSIEIKSDNIPKSIQIDASNLPNFISLSVPDFQSIKIDASELPQTIKVVGIPDSIEVKIPSQITAKLEIPENLEIPLVYKGGPVPIQFDSSNLLGGEDRPCFALVPCEPKK